MAKIKSFFTALILILTYVLGFGGITVSEGYDVVDVQKLDPITSLHSAQGICFDGENFYCSGAMTAVHFTGLAKFDSEMNCLKKRCNAVPEEFTEKYGSNHIGGIDCANGYIYAPVEGKQDYTFILLYDCETLEYTGKYYDMTCDSLSSGIPWCAIDRENGYLYTSPFRGVKEILQYDLETMELLRTISLQTEITRIQGGSVYNGVLYLSYDVAESSEDQVLAVEPTTGAVSLVFTRNWTNYDNEAEDICVYPLEDGSLYHLLDYDKLLNVNVGHYKPM